VHYIYLFSVTIHNNINGLHFMSRLYLWWLQEDETFAALGIFGQMIWINPKDDIVIAMQSSWPTAVGQELGAHRLALVAAIEKHLNR
jgi:CubicO group peptidase (beta-lactamase class C family)